MTGNRALARVFAMAARHMPDVEVEVLPGTARWDVIAGLSGQSNLGIELGVASGRFSRKMVESGKFARFWGVDSYSDGHDTAQYKQALLRVGLLRNYALLRMTFSEALDLFPDAFFDFVYVDGYAHTGEEGGQTMIDWFAKVKPGGILAGDDYDPMRWPLVAWGVHHLVAQLGVRLSVTDQVQSQNYSRFPSWFLTKPLTPPDKPLMPDPVLVQLGREERQRVAVERAAREAAAKDSPPSES